MSDGLYRVEMPTYVAGFIVDRGRIIHAAPILRWSIGKTPEAVKRWVAGKGGQMAWVDE